jgi:hypothetical protein
MRRYSGFTPEGTEKLKPAYAGRGSQFGNRYRLINQGIQPL